MSRSGLNAQKVSTAIHRQYFRKILFVITDAFFEADRSPIAAGGTNGLPYPQPLAAPPRRILGILRLCHSSCPPPTAEMGSLPGLPALVVVGVSGKVEKAAILGIRTHSLEGSSSRSALSLLRSCRAIANKPLLSRCPSHAYGPPMVSSRKCKPTSITQSGDGATVAYPLRRLRRKKMAVAKPTMPKMAP